MTWLRKKNKYSRPRKPYDKPRIEAENILVKEYGLKNKKEIWKADAAVERIRNQGKKLITASQEEQQKLFDKLNKKGFKVERISDILGLTKEDWLKRRLQSVLVRNKRVTPREARQLIAHKHVSINGRIVNVPSYVVDVDEEDKIEIPKRHMREAKKDE